MTRVLIVGGGAREHALAWKLRQSPDVRALYAAPGNPGTAALAENVPIAATDLPALVRLVEERDIDLTVVGPEAPLALGLADALRARGRRVVGPGAAAAGIESSKAFAKEVMRRAGVPTAGYAVFDAPDDALRHVGAASYPLVVKADGLASGKGVAICADLAEARAALEAMMVDRVYGAAGSRVVVEEYLRGPEVSLLALVDGERVVPLPAAQDHKRLGDGDTGPNTGGMGAYAPVPFASGKERDRLASLLIEPIVAALAGMGAPYRGILFAGLILTENGPRVLEYNCRFGDPEAQAVLPLMGDDLLPWLEAVAAGRLTGPVPVSEGSAAAVVLAAPGYPERPRTGAPIEGLDEIPDGVLLFHAGTAVDAGGQVVTAGGRVLTVVGTGATLEEALGRAYAAPISFPGMQRRTDIGWQATRSHDREEGTPRRPPEVILSSAIGASPQRPTGRARIAVLASGDGSNLQALLDACASGALDAEIAVAISHRVGARALERAHAAGVPAVILPLAARSDPVARRLHEEQVLETLAPFAPHLIVLAGWMLVLSADFLARCRCPLLNVHPALLPIEGRPLDIPILRGPHAVRDALSLGLQYTGVSVHHVTPEVDAGPVIVREAVEVLPGDDENSLYRRIKEVEHRLLVQAIGAVLESAHTGGVYA